MSTVSASWAAVVAALLDEVPVLRKYETQVNLEFKVHIRIRVRFGKLLVIKFQFLEFPVSEFNDFKPCLKFLKTGFNLAPT